MKITAEISGSHEEYFRELMESIDTGNRDPKPADAIEYLIGTMATLEKVIMRVANLDDPLDFVKGIADGSIIIVKKA